MWAAEAPALRGERPFAGVVAELAARWGLAGREAGLLQLWRRVEVDEGVRALVGDLRAAGLGCHLATNQNDVRAAYLLEEMGYAELFDRCFCSCVLGATKDDPAFLAHVLAELGLPAAEVVLVDDHPAYADTARAAGMRAVTWRLEEGLPALRHRLGEAGVRLSG
nr:HAD-IA family hydrolase [Nocardioides sp. zg-DK7169]